MAYSMFYFDEVELDLNEARVWYKATDEKLEFRFLKALETTILKIQGLPKAYSIRYRNIRIAHPLCFLIQYIFILMKRSK